MAKKGRDGLTAAQRKALQRYTAVGTVVAVAVMALFMVYYQMTAFSRGAAPGPQVLRSGTATVSGCHRESSTLWTMYYCRGDDLRWTTTGPDTPGSNVEMSDQTQAVSIWSHTFVSGTVAVESHPTQDHERPSDVYKDHEILMPVGQFDDAGAGSYLLKYLGVMAVVFLAIVYGTNAIGRRRVLARTTR